MRKRTRRILWAAFVFVLVLIFCGTGFATSLRVSWDANTESDLDGYKVFYATPSDPGWASTGDSITYTLGSLPRVTEKISGTSLILPDVAPGPYAVGVIALDTAGNESQLSEIKSILVPNPPVQIEVPVIQRPPQAPVQIIINIEQ